VWRTRCNDVETTRAALENQRIDAGNATTQGYVHRAGKTLSQRRLNVRFCAFREARAVAVLNFTA
jgi:hypothetical protein